jgi:hypothetical protein
MTVVGHKHHISIIPQTKLIELLQECADATIHIQHHGRTFGHSFAQALGLNIPDAF